MGETKERTILVVPGDETIIKINVKPALRDWLIQCIKDSGEKEAHPVHFYALGHLIGISPAQAVRIANHRADKEGHAHITTRDFCRWFTEVMSRFFDESFQE